MKTASLILFLTSTIGLSYNIYASHEDFRSKIDLYKSLSVTTKMWCPHSPISSYADKIVMLLINYNHEADNYEKALQENNFVKMSRAQIQLLKCKAAIEKNEKLINKAI